MTTIKVRRDTAANWLAANPVLALAEPGLETDTSKIKYGDGTSEWSALPYAGSGDVSSLVNGASNVSISTANGVPTIARAPYFIGPSSYPARTWTFGSGPIGSALAIPGLVQGPSQTGLISADNYGLVIDSANTPASISLGLQDGNANLTKFFWGSGSKNGIAGDVEIQTIPVGGTPTSIILSPQGGQNGSFIFGGTGNLTFPDSTVQTTAYAGPQIHQTTVTLTPSDLAGLNQYPGKTLVSGGGLASNQVIVVTALEFSLTYNTTPYTTSANLYLNYSGNYLTVAQPIPAGNTTANNNVGMLTASRNTYRYVQNSMVDGDFPPQQDVILMADNNILDGDSNLNVRVTYIITTLF